MVKKYLSVSEKLTILEQVDQRQKNGESLRSIAQSFGVQPNQIRRWRGKRDEFVRTKKTKKALTTGRTSSLKHVEADLIQWFLDLREDGVGLDYRALCIKAARLDQDFAQKSFRQQYQTIRRLFQANAISVRTTKHLSQATIQDIIDLKTTT